jgi:hypothetical protein
VSLWNGESGWNYRATYPTSGAYGIPQALPPSKMGSIAGDWLTNPITQMRWGLGYIRDAYGSPANALSAWASRSPHWYDGGGLAGSAGWMPKGPAPERVLSPRQTVAFERAMDRGFGGNATFNLYDKDNVLIGTMQGVAADQVYQHASHMQDHAGMSL